MKYIDYERKEVEKNIEAELSIKFFIVLYVWTNAISYSTIFNKTCGPSMGIAANHLKNFSEIGKDFHSEKAASAQKNSFLMQKPSSKTIR